MKISPYILCGGKGERLKPLSSVACPKPFLTLGADKTLLAQTAARVDGDLFSKPYFMANKHSAHLIDEAQVIVEPLSRNTAASVALATIKQKEGVMLILPADHWIEDKEAFVASIKKGLDALADHDLVILGTQPTAPSPLYGYIKKGKAYGDKGDKVFQVERFEEKPSAEKAATYLAEKNHLWNMGMFLFSAERISTLFEHHQPQLWQAIKQDDFEGCPALPFDKALVEKLEKIAVVETDFSWRDIGSFQEVATVVRQSSADSKKQPWGEHYFFDDKAHLFFIEQQEKIPLPQENKEQVCLVLTGEVRLISGEENFTLSAGEQKTLPAKPYQVEAQKGASFMLVALEG